MNSWYKHLPAFVWAAAPPQGGFVAIFLLWEIGPKSLARGVNFLILNLKVLTTFDGKIAKSFNDLIWNQSIFLVDTLEDDNSQEKLLL